MKKKLLSLLLVICMVIGMLPMIAMADAPATIDVNTPGYNHIIVEQGKVAYAVHSGSADANGYYGAVTTDGASATNYNLMVEYPADGVPTLHLNGLKLKGTPSLKAVTSDVNADVNVIIEDDSSIYSGHINNSALHFSTKGTVTFTSVEDATLTATASHYMEPTAVIAVDGDLYFEDANVIVAFDGAEWPKCDGIYVPGDFVVDGGNLTVGYNLSASSSYDADNAVVVGGDLTIQNGANVLLMVDEARSVLSVSGEITISDSTFEGANTFDSNRVVFNKVPTLNYTNGYVAVAGTTCATNNYAENKLVAPSTTVEFVLENATSYPYVKIAPVANDEEGGEGGDVDMSNLEDFRFEFWNGGYETDKTFTDLKGIAQGSETLYFAQTEADADGYSYLVATDDTENYVLKIAYPENDWPTVYLKGLNMVNPGGGIAGLLFESATNSLDVNLVIEEDSSYTIGGEGYYGGIECYTSGTFTISSAVDPETGKLATLTMYGEDTGDTFGSGPATIWHRGNLVIDGAALDISDDEGHAIGAAGTITVIDSEIKAWSEDTTAFNKAVDIQGELGAIASTTHVPNDPDLVEYNAENADSYKYVHIGPDVELPAALGSGEAWDVPVLNAGEAKYYLATEIGDLTEEGASAENYDVALVYDENGATIYLDGVNLKNPSPINYSGTAPLTIVVEADSSLYAVGNTYPAIVAPVDTVIKSEGEAVLTVTADGPPQFASTGNGNQIDGAIRVVGDLTLEQANLNIEFPENCGQHSGIVVDGGDLVVDGGNLNIGKGYTTTANNALQIMNNANGGGNVTFQNGANFVMMTNAAQRPLRYDGSFTISDSNFEAGSTDVAGTRRIFRGALPTITGDYTIVGSTSAPTVDSVNFVMTAPADTTTIDPATLIDTYYYYVKITVNEEEPEEPDVPVEPAYKFGNTVTCNETLDLNFYLPKDAVPMAATWIVTYGGNVLEEGEYSLDLQADGRMRVRVSYYPHQLNTEVSVTCLDANGVVLAQRSNSIQGYCMAYLGLASGKALDRALMVAMLEYGSLAQLGVANGDAAAAGPLANRDLTAAHRAYLTGYEWPTSGVPTVFAENNKTLQYTFSSSVTCNETLDLNFYLNANATDKAASWIVTINGEEVSEDKYIISKDASNRWRIRVPFLANQMNSLVSVTCKDAEGNVIAQRSNSIREYAMLYLSQASATALDSALMVAMLEFGSLAQIGLNQTDVLANYLLNDTYRAKLTQYAWPN